MKNIKILFLIFITVLVMNSCDLIDPTEVTNPNVTELKIVGRPNSTSLWMVGLKREMAIVYNNLTVIGELASDNYVNTQTFYNQNFDKLDIRFNDSDVNVLQFAIADLRESASKGIDLVHANDSESTEAQLAELYFHRGWSYLLAGEIFKTLPAEGNGVAIPANTHIENAIADFLKAESIDDSNVSYKLALARAYYYKKDKANAVIKANEAIGSDDDFLEKIEYDAINGPGNRMQDALVDRGTYDDLQPLPSLDFLDPKQYRVSSTEDSPVYFQKIEEAHLILAEAKISDGELSGANEIMKTIIMLVSSRNRAKFNDKKEGRTNDAENDKFNRPDTTTATVAFQGEPARTGLVLNRQSGDVSVPVISGTSLNDADVDALVTEDDYLEILYLMRQEIFITEGRRWIDLGIKLPVSEVEQLSNSNITDADVTVAIPSFLPKDMDMITYDVSTSGAEVCTIKHNVNKILVANKADAAVLPFH